MALAGDDVLRVPPRLDLETSDVFVVDADKCKIKTFELESNPEKDSSSSKATVLKRASSRKDLESLLGVSQISSLIVMPFVF